MKFLNTYPMQNSAILRINSEKEIINIYPGYQREGEIWNLEKRQLLIDSILNDYDIPKIYFHLLPKTKKALDKKDYSYAVIDGRQRLEAIWGFINGDFGLSKDFEFLKDNSVKAGNLTYSELAKEYPKLKVIFDSFTLSIILVETDNFDLIEDMFSRLNEAVGLNAAEKRNAFGGGMAKLINKISGNDFFIKKVSFKNWRYRYKEIIARLLFLEYSIHFDNKIIDTKKPYLDELVRKYKGIYDASELKLLNENILLVLKKMSEIFIDKDKILRFQSYIPIFYLLFKQAINQNKMDNINREKFIEFQNRIRENKEIAEKNISQADFDFLEFSRLSQQGTNDASSIRERLRIISIYFNIAPSILEECKK